MSKFKVGDRVRCVSATGSMSVGEIDTVFNADPHDGTMQLSKNGGWWFRQSAFELVPHPAESPDDWVTQDVVVRRDGVDECRWISASNQPHSWEREWCGGVDNAKHGDVHNQARLEVRCRRRDYPQPAVQVHIGGPYVARSEYERVCVERDEGWAQAARIRDEAVKLAQARDKAIYDLNAVRATLEKRDAEVANLRHEQSVLLADLKDIEQTVIHLNKRVFADNPNGWPLVPVDPSCIPAGHRAVEVTCSTQNKWVTSYNNQARLFMSNDEYPRLVVEPIPTPQAPDTLPRPEFPAWIRAGWWVAMDADSDWFGYGKEPTLIDELKQWKSTIPFPIIISQLTPSMRAVPRDRWRVAKWQIE